MNGFYRIAAASPRLAVADPHFNAAQIAACSKEAAAQGAHAVVFPELALTGSTCGDLFGNRALEEAAFQAIDCLCRETAALSSGTLLAVGAPLREGSRLFNCVLAIQNGRVIGVVPKACPTGLFSPAAQRQHDFIGINGVKIPFGEDVLFELAPKEGSALRVGIEIGSDRLALIPPSAGLAANGAHLILNPAAEGETMTGAEIRREGVRIQSRHLFCCYAHAGAGVWESTDTAACSGHLLIAVDGRLLGENPRFERGGACIYADFAPDWIDRLRRAAPAFNASPRPFKARIIECEPPAIPFADLARAGLSCAPFTALDPAILRERCREIFRIQAAGLAKRFLHTGSRRLVLGLSGGLDSTLALLACLEMCEALALPAATVLGITMPGFGTSGRTRANVDALAAETGIELRAIPIADAVSAHFADIGHDPARLDAVFENAQARERTQILMDVANGCGGIVVGTGDLSEGALGWCTFNGDHMAMYGVNGGVPKTLMPALIETWAESAAPALAAVLRDIADTPVSPELLPGEQHTETIVGHYALHDFFLYYFIRFGLGRADLLDLARALLHDRYDDATLARTCDIFLTRFVTQQFKRNSLPDGPAVGSISLTPRDGWKMPADASPALFRE